MTVKFTYCEELLLDIKTAMEKDIYHVRRLKAKKLEITSKQVEDIFKLVEEKHGKSYRITLDHYRWVNALSLDQAETTIDKLKKEVDCKNSFQQ